MVYGVGAYSRRLYVSRRFRGWTTRKIRVRVLRLDMSQLLVKKEVCGVSVDHKELEPALI